MAAACQELEIDDPDSKITQLNGMSKDERLSFIIDIANKVVDKCGIVTDALLNKTVADTKDGVYNYSHALCHYAALCLEFTDALENGNGNNYSMLASVPSTFSCQRMNKVCIRSINTTISASNPQAFTCSPVNLGTVH